MPPHPANQKPPRLHIYTWRFFTGLHLDGKARTNATWFKPGTAPPHHLNWWSKKPRFHKMMWRWAIVGLPIAWITCYAFAPTYGINLMVIITLAFIPYAFHHGVMKVMRLIPQKTVVYVHDNIRVEDVDDELDNITIPEMLERQENIDNILDVAIEEDDVPTSPRKRRRT